MTRKTLTSTTTVTTKTAKKSIWKTTCMTTTTSRPTLSLQEVEENNQRYAFSFLGSRKTLLRYGKSLDIDQLFFSLVGIMS